MASRRELRRSYEDGWHSAIRLYRHLARGGEMATTAGPPSLLEPGEVDLAEAMFHYSRYYGGLSTAPRWRDEQFVFTIATDRRLLCDVAGAWAMLRFSALKAVLLRPDEWAVELEFRGTVPLRLQGPMAPAFCLIVVYVDRGPAGLGLDIFAPLASGAPPPLEWL